MNARPAGHSTGHPWRAGGPVRRLVLAGSLLLASPADAGEKPAASLNAGAGSTFTAPGWRIEPAETDALTLKASVPGAARMDPAPLWTMYFYHGPYVSGPPRRASRRFRRLFSIADAESGGLFELCHLADRRDTTDVGCWIARALEPRGDGMRIRVQNQNGLLTAGPEELARGDSMGLSLALGSGSAGNGYRLGEEELAFPSPPPEPGRRENRKHTIAPGTRLVVRSKAEPVFTLWLGVRGSLDVVTVVNQDRLPIRSIEYSTGEPRLDLWWAPGDATPPGPDAPDDDWIAAAMRQTLAGPAPERVRVARKAIDGLGRLASQKPGTPGDADLRARRQAFDKDVGTFTKLAARGKQPGNQVSLGDWIAIAALDSRIEESRKSLEALLVMQLIP